MSIEIIYPLRALVRNVCRMMPMVVMAVLVAFPLNVLLSPSYSYAARSHKRTQEKSKSAHKRAALQKAADRYLRIKGKPKKSKKKWAKKTAFWTWTISLVATTSLFAFIGAQGSFGLVPIVFSSVLMGAAVSAPIAMVGAVGGGALAGFSNLLRRVHVNRIALKTSENRAYESAKKSIDNMLDMNEKMIKEGESKAQTNDSPRKKTLKDEFVRGTYNWDPLPDN